MDGVLSDMRDGNRILSPDTLSVLVKPASADCNLACKYCFYASKQKLYQGSRRMNRDTLKKMIIQCLDITEKEVWFCWQGGEPTLMGLDFYREAIEIEEKYRRKEQKVYNTFQTNGLLLDESWANFLETNNFLVGISLDGPSQFHNIYRVDRYGNPTHALVLEKIKLLQAHEVQFNVLAVVTDKNSQHPEVVFDFFQGIRVNYMQFIPCLEIDKRNGLTSFSVDPDSYGNFLRHIFDRWYNDGNPSSYVREYEEWLVAYVYGNHPSCIFGRYCNGAPVIEYNGDVYPCDYFVSPHWLLGNINSVSLERILNTKLYQRFRMKKQNFDKRCLNCRWLSLCWGGCPKFRLNEKGEHAKHSYYCSAYKDFHNYSYDKFTYLANKDYEGYPIEKTFH